MRVEVRCYGSVREAVGATVVELALRSGATTADALNALGDEYSSVGRLLAATDRNVVVMRDRTHLDRDAALAEGDVIGVSTSPMPE